MQIESILNMRYQFEEIVSYRKTYDLPTYESNIDNLKYFIEHGHKNNRFRKRFDEAMELAKVIVEHYEGSMESLGRRLA